MLTRVLLIAALLTLAVGSAGARAVGSAKVLVTGQIVTQAGWPIGGFYYLFDGSSWMCLAHGRTDNRGKIRHELETQPGQTKLAIVVFSEGMIRNTLDEEERGIRHASWLAHPVSMEKERPSIHTPSEYMERYGGNHVRTAVHETSNYVNKAVDSVAKSVSIAGQGVVDLGELRLPRWYASLELTVKLRSSNGGAFAKSVVLGGYHATQGGSRNLYRHMALSQQGDTVRILLTRAATRQLAQNPSKMLVLFEKGEFGQGKNQLPCLVSLPKHAQEELRVGERRISFEFVVPDRPEELARVRRDAPTLPKFWSLGEPPLF